MPPLLSASSPAPVPTPSDRPAPPSAPPPLALALGYAGLLPFVAGALAVWWSRALSEQSLPADALATYAALIVSFLGGIHWGLGFVLAPPSPRRFVWGVMPSLGAWPALLMPPAPGLALLGLLLIVCYAVDRRVYPALGLAAWLTLRLRLTAVASLSCFAAAAAL